MGKHAKSRKTRPLKGLTNGMDTQDEFVTRGSGEFYVPDKKEQGKSFEIDSYNYNLVDPHFTEVNYCPEIAANIELASSPLIGPVFYPYSNSGSFLRSIESNEDEHSTNNMSNLSHKLPQIDKVSLTEALNEPEAFTSIQSTSETETMDLDIPDTEEDFLPKITSPHIEDFFSLENLDDIVDKSDFEDIFSQQNNLIQQFVEIVDNHSARQDVISYTTSQASPVRDYESLQSSTTQCNFAEDREKDRRQRNNIASRKSRAMKKERFAAMQSEIDQLKAANRKLRAIVDEMDAAIDEAKAIILPQKE